MVSVAAISFSDASRYVYHLYQNSDYYQQSRGQVRTVTNRIAPISNYGRSTYRNYNSHNRYGQTQNVYRHPSNYPNAYKYNPQYRGTQPFNPLARDANGAYKYGGHPGTDVRVENTFQTDRLVVRNGNYKEVLNYNPQSVQEALYGTQNQQLTGGQYYFNRLGFSQDRYGNFRSTDTNLALRINSTKASGCTGSNFENCTYQLTQDFVTRQNLSRMTNQTGSYRLNETNYLDRNDYPVIVESFDAVKNGRQYSYFIMTAINPTTQEVVRIEGIAPTQDKDMAARYAYRVFESFRFNAPR